ncbi:stage III sporulation protein AG [Virgibacillus byunsanensis]|uniref:Stage III sporulation protein AG n=1 Tax=Virgibacillus byunsanensis TaxID=570945 RepID=A0ABW3LLU5_9BACI
MKQKLKKLFEFNSMDKNSKKFFKKTGYLLVIGLLGLLLLIVGNAFTTSSEDEPNNNDDLIIQPKKETKETFSEDKSTTSDVDELEATYQKDLVEMLDKIQGVSDVEVMINLDSTKVKVYERNLITGQQTTNENDTNGGTREIEDRTEETQVVLVRQGDKEVPLLIQTRKPEVRGVFVVAKGVDHASVKQWVIEAVSRVLDVPTHRVSVMPKN